MARGRNRTISKKFFPLKSEVEINQAGIIPSIRENIEVRITKYSVLNEQLTRRLFHKQIKFSRFKPKTLQTKYINGNISTSDIINVNDLTLII